MNNEQQLSADKNPAFFQFWVVGALWPSDQSNSLKFASPSPVSRPGQG